MELGEKKSENALICLLFIYFVLCALRVTVTSEKLAVSLTIIPPAKPSVHTVSNCSSSGKAESLLSADEMPVGPGLEKYERLKIFTGETVTF